MRPTFKLRFSTGRVRWWSRRYQYRSEAALERIGAEARTRGYLTPRELRVLAHWKTPRSAPRVVRNDREFVRETTRLAFSTRSERLRVEALTLLEGVNWPTASVILHFVYPRRYAILDYRALWSLGIDPPPPYGFEFWERYVRFTRSKAQRLNVSMRVLDRALWQFSKERQS
jgi:hypothetical protein